MMRWSWHVACLSEMRNDNILGGKPEGNMPLGRPKRTWENNITMNHTCI
jgi:hypothetical protein